MKALPSNYQKNVEILRENLKRGMTAGQAYGVIRQMRGQFERANLYGDTEKAYINAMCSEVEEYTHIKITEVA